MDWVPSHSEIPNRALQASSGTVLSWSPHPTHHHHHTNPPTPRTDHNRHCVRACQMYRRHVVQSAPAAVSALLASASARGCSRLISRPPMHTTAAAAAAASAALHTRRGLATHVKDPSHPHHQHAASAESASEFLDDADLLRDQGYIGGQWVGSSTSMATYEVKDPATHVVIAKIPAMGAADVRLAVDAANGAWDAWRHKTPKERGDVLRRWYDLMNTHLGDLAKILTLEVSGWVGG